VGRHAEVLEREHDPAGAEQVDLDGSVERRVEGHGRGRVHHDVAARQRGPAGVVEAEPVPGDVAGDDRDPPGHHLVELGGAQLGPQPVEGVVAEHLAPRPLVRRGPLAGPDEQHQLAPGDGPQQPLDQRRAEKAGRAGDGDALAVECLGDHAHLSTIW
jgi:hypothetical protein